MPVSALLVPFSALLVPFWPGFGQFVFKNDLFSRKQKTPAAAAARRTATKTALISETHMHLSKFNVHSIPQNYHGRGLEKAPETSELTCGKFDSGKHA